MPEPGQVQRGGQRRCLDFHVRARHQPDDGTAASVTVTLGDQFGNADSCQQVLLTPMSKTSHAVVSMNYPTGYATTDPCYQKGYTNAKGVATFQVSDTAAEQVVLGVTDTTAISVWPTDPMANGSDVAQINFEGADAATSSVVASPTTAPADGQPAAAVTVTLEDVAGQVEQGKVVTLEGCTNDPVTATCVQDPTSIITPTSAPTTRTGRPLSRWQTTARRCPTPSTTRPSSRATA